MKLNDYLTVAEAARRMGCTTSRVRQLLRSGSLAGRKITGTAWLVDGRDAKRFCKQVPGRGRPRSGAGR